MKMIKPLKNPQIETTILKLNIEWLKPNMKFDWKVKNWSPSTMNWTVRLEILLRMNYTWMQLRNEIDEKYWNYWIWTEMRKSEYTERYTKRMKCWKLTWPTTYIWENYSRLKLDQAWSLTISERQNMGTHWDTNIELISNDRSNWAQMTWNYNELSWIVFQVNHLNVVSPDGSFLALKCVLLRYKCKHDKYWQSWLPILVTFSLLRIHQFWTLSQL